MLVTMVKQDPVVVICSELFEPTGWGSLNRLFETKFEVSTEDFVLRVNEPFIIAFQRNCLFYSFN